MISLPLSTRRIEFVALIFLRSFSFPYPPKIILPITGSFNLEDPTMGITVYGFSLTSNVATKLDVKLLYVAPTVTEP